jgi:hypothetical protein
VPSFNLGVVSSALVPLPVVTGGELSSDSTYYYRLFNSSGSLVVDNASLDVEVRMLGGGGGGSLNVFEPNYTGGHGGGAGWYNFFSTTATVGTHTVVVGAGGSPQVNGTHSSVFETLSGFGGGFGDNYYPNGNTALLRGSPYYIDFGYGGPGGAGILTNGSGTDTAPQFGFGASGGSGAVILWNDLFTRGIGGDGGPGAYADTAFGSQYTPPYTQNGQPNTGDGGDGGTEWWMYSYGNSNYNPRNGGSGLVVIRYLRSAVGG